MSGSIQSSNYVPGVSGWKFNEVTGEFEINPVRPSPSADAQMITETAGEWSEYDLPANAIERYAFIGAELAKIPIEYRESAEFNTRDFSYDCDGSDVRTTLSYARLENQDEVVARLERAKVAGIRIVRAGGCTTGIIDGVVRWRLGDLAKADEPEPFKVVGDETYINRAFVEEGSVAKAKVASEQLTHMWSIKVKVTPEGKRYAAGFGVGINSQFLVGADRFAVNGRDASQILHDISALISTAKLCQMVKDGAEQLGPVIASQVREVIRTELMPGGLLHRSR